VTASHEPIQTALSTEGARAQRAPSGLGLVNIETSDTRPPAFVVPGSQLSEFRHRRRCSRMKRALVFCADIQQRQLQARQARFRAAFITLTYRPGEQYEARHVSECVKRLRHWCARRNWRLPYEWKAELQKRGAVHYHLVVWFPICLGIRALRLDELSWWPHGMTQFQWARKDPVRYIAKYISKVESEEMPKGLRMHGRGGLDAECRRQVRYELLPSYVREKVKPSADVVRANGGGWLDRITGEWIAALPFVIDWSA